MRGRPIFSNKTAGSTPNALITLASSLLLPKINSAACACPCRNASRKVAAKRLDVCLDSAQCGYLVKQPEINRVTFN